MLNLVRKGNKRSAEALAPATARVLESYIGERTSGPIFLNGKGELLTEPTAWRLVRRLARQVGLPAADRLSPHSLRHSTITAAHNAGVPFRDVRTSPATPTPARPGATTGPATAWTATPPTHSPLA